ncbi:MAG TPA: helix-hairpin-helix domain-containing protein [Longimicrobiales bacterium]|nr:helix-hairpin-helix domain-containing protein [Longimicrobiales bacterium]
MKEQARILDANTATREELVERGVLPVLADRIVRHRAEHGPFRDENELYDVVRDNEIRMDQLLGLVGLPNRENPQGYST